MKHYIDKSALVAEIKERIKTYNKGYANGDDRRADALEVLLHDIDILEAKEVDLEKEIKDYFKNQPIIARSKGIDYQFIPSGEEIAKHFFELGLRAQKGE